MHVKSLHVLKDFNMRLLITFQIILLPAIYEYPFHGTPITHCLCSFQSVNIAFNLCQVARQIVLSHCFNWFSLIISEVEHFLDYIDWLFPTHYSGHSSPVLA